MSSLHAINKNAISFLEVSNQLRDLMLSSRIPYYTPPTSIVENFNSLDISKQIGVISKIGFYIDITRAELAQSWAAINDHKLTWYALSKLGLKPPCSLFSYLDPMDCIEIYDAEGVQLFRNFNFCNYCTYSLEELLIYPWTELYERERDVLAQMHQAAARALFQEKEPFEAQISAHVGIELRSRKKREVAVRFGYVSPLFDSTGHTKAFLVTSKLEVLLEKQTGESLSHLSTKDLNYTF